MSEPSSSGGHPSFPGTAPTNLSRVPGVAASAPTSSRFVPRHPAVEASAQPTSRHALMDHGPLAVMTGPERFIDGQTFLGQPPVHNSESYHLVTELSPTEVIPFVHPVYDDELRAAAQSETFAGASSTATSDHMEAEVPIDDSASAPTTSAASRTQDSSSNSRNSQSHQGLGWSDMRCSPGAADSRTRDRSLDILRALANEQDNSFYDVTFEVQSRRFRAHRAILAVQSKVFRTMFTSGMREQLERTIVLREVQPDVFSVVLRFAYGGVLHDVPQGMLVEVFQFAHCMDMPKLESASANSLTRGLLGSMADLRDMWFKTCGPMSIASEQIQGNSRSAARNHGGGPSTTGALPRMTGVPPEYYGMPDAAFNDLLIPRYHLSDPLEADRGLVIQSRKSPITYLAKEMEEVLDSSEFLQFPFILLERVLQSNSIAVPEVLLFERAMAWASAKGSSVAELEDILKHIRFELMPSDDLHAARKNTTARMSPRFESRLLDATRNPDKNLTPRAIGRPHFMFELEVGRVTLPFTADGMVFRVGAARVVAGNRHGIKVFAALSDDMGSKNKFALIYARSASGRGVISGRILPLYMSKRAWESDKMPVPDQLLMERMQSSAQRDSTRDECQTTLWDVSPGEIVYVAVEVFTRPGSYVRSSDSSSIRAIAPNSPLMWDAEDVRRIEAPVQSTLADCMRNPMSVSAGPSNLHWNTFI